MCLEVCIGIIVLRIRLASERSLVKSYYIALLCFVQVDPATAYLREEFGQRAFFPDASNEFHLPSCVGVTIFSLIVEGSQHSTQPTNQTTTAVACLDQAQ